MTAPRDAGPVADIGALVDQEAPGVRAFIRSRSPQEAETALALCPELADGEYDAVLDRLTDAASAQGAAAAFMALREVLRDLRSSSSPETAGLLGRIALTAAARAEADGDLPSARRALTAWERLIASASFATVPGGVRAVSLNGAGLAHARCRELGGGQEHEAAALAFFERASAEALQSGERATDYRRNVLTARLGQAEQDPDPPLDELLALAEDILAGANADPRDRAAAFAGVAAARRLRFLKLGAVAELDAAARAAEAAVGCEHDDEERLARHREELTALQRLQRSVVGTAAVGPERVLDHAANLAAARAAAQAAGSPFARAEAEHALSLAAYRAAMASGRLELLDEAVATAESSLRLTPSSAAAYAPRANDFGMLLRQRYEDRGEPGDLWKSISALRTAVGCTPPADPDWPGRAMNLGNALTHLHELTRERGPLHEAIEQLEELVRRSPAAAPERGGHLTALSRALRLRYAAESARADLERSLELDAEALAATPETNPARWLLLGNAANGLSLMAAGRDDSWQRAVALWDAGCRGALEHQPGLTLMNALRWLEAALQHDAPGDATVAVDLARDALDRLVAAQAARRDEEEWLARAQRLPSLAAQVLVAAGDVPAAVLAVEHARGSLFSRLLHGADGAARPALGELRDLARDAGPLVYLVPAERGVALVVDADCARAVPLPLLTSDAVMDAVMRLYRAYFAREHDGAAWRDAFDEVTRWLWKAAMGPVLGALDGATRINLLPGGRLALLPLHAAWEPRAERQPSERRYAGDDVLVVLQANARLLLSVRRRAGGAAPSRGVVAVADPRPSAERPLRWAAVEAQAAGAAASAMELLAHEDATPERVLDAIADAGVVHLACHGRADVEDGLAGGLILADDRVLTVGALLERTLAARLVVVTACESASVAPGLPDEVVSFAAALLSAGSDAVLASAFAVDDFNALVVAARFYAAWTAGTPGPDAMRAAVRFLRDTTNAEKLAWVEESRRRRLPAAVADALAGMLGFTPPQAYSFAHPVEWAPFVWWGGDARA